MTDQTDIALDEPSEATDAISESAAAASPTPPETAEPMPRGRFPVLGKASPTAAKPWLLPREPTGPGIAADEGTLGGLEVRAASIVGPGHRTSAKPRQDAYRIGQDQAGRYLIIAVADGMTDSRYSDVGANVAAVALVAGLRTALDSGVALRDLDALDIFTGAAAQMYQLAKQREWSPDDVRSVAVAAVVPAWPDGTGERTVWLAAVGDASAWTLAENTWNRATGVAKDGLEPNRVSSFLPHVVDEVVVGLCALERDHALALMTDGVSDALELGRAASDWFAERWRRPPSACAFLLDVGFDQAQMHDDRTAVMVWSGEEAER